jgi:hypothetical protein
MLDVDVPMTTATRAAPQRCRASVTASRNPSAFRRNQARRWLRQSQGASEAGSGVSSPSTRPIQVASGTGPKSLRRRPPRCACTACDMAERPLPSAEVAV